MKYIAIFFEKIFGYRLLKKQLFVLHKYSSYEEYVKSQVKTNKRKIDKVFADEYSLFELLKALECHGCSSILCHGSRNGFELEIFRKYFGSEVEVFGTDISDTAKDFNLVQMDFHDEVQNWKEKFDIVYSNSWDQSYDPMKAFDVWLGQVCTNGYLILEMTRLHEIGHAGEMDPFGIYTEFIPYFLIVNSKESYKFSFKIFKSVKSNLNIEVTYFVIKKLY